MNVTYLKDRTFRPAYIKTTTALLPYDLGDELIGALLKANLSDPLDALDMDEDMRVRIREGGP